MQWNDLIEKLMIDNGGSASLAFLYENAHRYKKLPGGDWQKTLRGVLYRDVKKGRFIKVGLGVYAVPDFSTQNSAYSTAIKEGDSQDFITRSQDPHSTIEGMLIELGNFYDFLTYTCDKNKTFDGKSLSSIERLQKIPLFTYDELIKAARRMDVIWFSKKAKHIFPKYIYEVENSTDFTNSMLKMIKLKEFDTKFVLASWEARKKIFEERMEQEPFHQIKSKFTFKSFELVSKLYFSAVEHFELEAKYFEQD